ncbi:hypothetical protein RUM43_008187 [Polyplax serrata]|uniref:Synaptobrevin homolog YKT6 n=1 Tax=Polyplax serrata TaxID=468196 RepID=A0AAN8PED2_POLSC
MVKLYSLSVLHKKDMTVTWLKTTHDLSSFNFFQRGCVQEFMSFVGKTLVQRTQVATRQSVKEGEYMCHVFVNIDGLAGVLISDHEYPTRVAHTLLTKVLADFASSVPQNLWSTGNEDTITYNQLPVYLSKYQVPKEIDAMTRIQEELDETKIILHNTCEAVLRRGENLDNLVSKSEELSLQAKGFYKTARKTNSCCSYM